MPVLRIKEGVRLEGLQPEAVVGLWVCASVFFEYGYDCIVTSVTDGDHMTNSLHHVGKAFDLRRHHVSISDISVLTGDMRSALGDEFDVVLESNHFHVEHDPS